MSPIRLAVLCGGISLSLASCKAGDLTEPERVRNVVPHRLSSTCTTSECKGGDLDNDEPGDGKKGGEEEQDCKDDARDMDEGAECRRRPPGGDGGSDAKNEDTHPACNPIRQPLSCEWVALNQGELEDARRVRDNSPCQEVRDWLRDALARGAVRAFESSPGNGLATGFLAGNGGQYTRSFAIYRGYMSNGLPFEGAKRREVITHEVVHQVRNLPMSQESTVNAITSGCVP